MPYSGTRWHRLTPSGSQVRRNWPKVAEVAPKLAQVGPSWTQVGPKLAPRAKKKPNRTNKGVVGTSEETKIMILSSSLGSKKWYF